MFKKTFLCLVVTVLAGCGYVSQAEREEILRQDPGFAETLSRKHLLDGQIKEIEKGSSRKQASLQIEIRKLQRQSKAQKGELKLRVAQLKGELDNERAQILQELEGYRSNLRLKKDRLRQLNKMLKAHQRLIKTSLSVELATGEREKWQEKTGLLSREIALLKKEITELQYLTRLTRCKLTLLEQ